MKSYVGFVGVNKTSITGNDENAFLRGTYALISMSILYHHKKANFSERTVKLYHVTPVLICNVTLRFAMQRLLGISLSDQLIVALRLLKLFVNI